MKRLACIIALAVLVFGLAVPKQSEANDVVWALLGGLLLGAVLSDDGADEAPAYDHACNIRESIPVCPAPVYVNPPHSYGYSQRENSGHRRDGRHAPLPPDRRDRHR